MDSDRNPYSPPTAALGLGPKPAQPEEAFPPDGDLAQALVGAIRLNAGAAVREGWARSRGRKRGVNIAFFLFSWIYGASMIVVTALTFALAGLNFTDLFDPMLTTQITAELTSNGAYLAAASLLTAPVNALLYLSVWNVGLRLASGQEVRFADTLPARAMGSAVLVMLCLAPLGMLPILHPTAGYLSLPVWMLTMWSLPLLLDRDIGVGEALRTSFHLTRHNILAILGLGVALLVGYFAAVITCGIGLVWFLPVATGTLGSAWRQLAGLGRLAPE
ncbi:MAG: hypothetical protein CL927_08105 [Deltaproteobacteria bacterium]|nr:hypothetical protein [Deltaproteobacteria bacterium]HCH61675.1 hypothetical protein [Deltaproteobacteria bacterium]